MEGLPKRVYVLGFNCKYKEKEYWHNLGNILKWSRIYFRNCKTVYSIFYKKLKFVILLIELEKVLKTLKHGNSKDY